METGHGWDGPGTIRRGRGQPEHFPPTPDRAPTGATSAFSNVSGRVVFEQDALPHVEGGDPAGALMLAPNSDCEVERGFRVQVNIEQGPDGGLRQKFVQGIAFGRDEDLLDEDGLSGVREPRRGPGCSGAGLAAVQPSFAREPESLALTAV